MNTPLGYNVSAADLYHDMSRLIEDHSDWSQATFGRDDERGPTGSLNHLSKEVQETIESIVTNQPLQHTAEEFADCLLLLLDAMRRQKISFIELLKISNIKLQVCKLRKWNVNLWQYTYNKDRGDTLYTCTATKKVGEHTVTYTASGSTVHEARTNVLPSIRSFEDMLFTEHTR